MASVTANRTDSTARSEAILRRHRYHGIREWAAIVAVLLGVSVAGIGVVAAGSIEREGGADDGDRAPHAPGPHCVEVAAA